MTNRQTDILRLLEICRDIEAHCASMYNLFQDLFAADEELRQLWSKMNAEEENHARQFAMAIGMRLENDIAGMNIEREKATRMLHKVKKVYDSFLAHPPSIADALRATIILERSLSGFHLNVVASFNDESLKRLFDAMIMADNEHVGAIEYIYTKRVGSEVEPIW